MIQHKTIQNNCTQNNTNTIQDNTNIINIDTSLRNYKQYIDIQSSKLHCENSIKKLKLTQPNKENSIIKLHSENLVKKIQL